MLGLADCQVSLGHMFELGLGVKQDYTPAVRYYKAAAEQGHAGAQGRLQAVYEKVNREYVDAQKAVALQQQTEQQQKQLQQRYQQQLVQANQQQIFQHLQQQAAARDAAAPTSTAPSVASIVAGTPSAGVAHAVFPPFVDDLFLILFLFVNHVPFCPCFANLSLPSPPILLILQLLCPPSTPPPCFSALWPVVGWNQCCSSSSSCLQQRSRHE
jgi:hypothetical protein